MFATALGPDRCLNVSQMEPSAEPPAAFSFNITVLCANASGALAWMAWRCPP
jgi:hypothetical protein